MSIYWRTENITLHLKGALDVVRRRIEDDCPLFNRERSKK